jgi:beta-glucosidase/6-phospho-beta-glucosidase/beta-galactosidase
VFPNGRGSINQRGLDFYKRLVAGLHKRRIAAVATLFHWDLPQALQDRGGWENRDCTGWFSEYAAVLFDALEGVQTWLTINEPKIIFLDEPTTGLDPQARRNLWDLIKQLREQGATVVLTTHYMDEAEVLCDRVAIIESGEIIALDSPDGLIDNLLASGFTRQKQVKAANLEDVFLNLTGKEWRDE